MQFVLAVIPARYASSRFPGKPLALICGKAMIQWVYERAQAASCFDAIVVATDHEDIQKAVEAFGGQAAMTSPDHASGTDRVWEVAERYPEATLIFNLQGDEPLMDPHYLEEAAQWLNGHHETIPMVTLKAPIQSLQELEDPNVVKVVTDTTGQALYFSRAPIPFHRDGWASGKPDVSACYRHIGMYGFHRTALARFVQWPVSPLETLEKLEQLRALEAGIPIQVLTVAEAPLGVDTPEDLNRVISRMACQSAS